MLLRKLSREMKWWQSSEINSLWKLGALLGDLDEVQFCGKEKTPALHPSVQRHFQKFKEKNLHVWISGGRERSVWLSRGRKVTLLEKDICTRGTFKLFYLCI